MKLKNLKELETCADQCDPFGRFIFGPGCGQAASKVAVLMYLIYLRV